MATYQATDSPSVEGIMQRVVRSFSGKGPTPSNVTILEEPASSTEGSSFNIAATSKTEGTTVSPSSISEKDHSSFSGVLNKLNFKNINLGLMTAPTPNGTLDQKSSAFDSNSEASHDEPFPTASNAVEPTYLASRIQSLIMALPFPSTSSPRSSRKPQRDNDGRPIPPPGVTQIDDARLIAMLRSATVMNGGGHGDDVRERRVSVWSVLESLDGEGGAAGIYAGGGGGEDDRSREDDVGEVSGIMMYSPLMPTNLSLVEIAESGVFNPEEQDPEEQIVNPTSETAQVAGWMGMWPFSVWRTNATVGSDDHPTANPAPSITTSPPSSPSGHNNRLRTQAKKRVWIPSTTNLSFQAVWWGYRIYLPPPVMDSLGDKSMEYAKRAATITTALTWFFCNIPLTALPAAVRPAVLLLQMLIPYIGYIGSFISWSWGTIQSYDTGHGVILTATWLLPVALIPSTWEANDFPPPSPSSPLKQCLPPPDPSTSPTPQSTAPLPTPPATPPSTTTPRPGIPVQLPAEQPLSPAQSFVTVLASPLQSPPPGPTPLSYLPLAAPASSPVSNANTVNTDRMLTPIQLVSPYPFPPSPALPHASESLPSWVSPPPPPSPPTIPLPEIEEIETPRFGMRVLGKVKASRRKEGRKKDERKEGQGKVRFRAIAGALSGRKDAGSKGQLVREHVGQTVSFQYPSR